MRVKEAARDEVLTDEQRRMIEELESIGYLQGYRPAPSEEGVVRYDQEQAFAGLNLSTSGHAAEAILMDMTGEVLHTWTYDFAGIWPERPRTRDTRFWRRAHLLGNGDLLAIFDGEGVVRLDRDSNLLWAYGGGSHHDLEVTDEGRIYVLDRELADVPWIHPRLPTLVDFITVLDLEGNLLDRVSIIDCFENSPYAPVLKRIDRIGDVFHTNTLEVFDGTLADRSILFKTGNILISILYLDTIAIVDPESWSVLWVLTGMWHHQHQPTLLENGHMLIFDNLGHQDHTRVLEFDPFTQEVVWSYAGVPPDEFFTRRIGSCQRLPNGNTLITESERGRALEVTPGGEIVWEYLNPHRAGEDDEYIATLLEVVRLPPEFPLGWLNRDAAVENDPISSETTSEEDG
jgi:hypothetical protein